MIDYIKGFISRILFFVFLPFWMLIFLISVFIWIPVYIFSGKDCVIYLYEACDSFVEKIENWGGE